MMASTKGGQGGKTVTVTNLSDFSKAVNEAGPVIVIVDGKFSNGKVTVKSDKTIVGRNGASQSPLPQTTLFRVSFDRSSS